MLPLTEKGTCTIVKKLDSLKNKPKDTFKVVNFLLDRQCNKNVYPNDQNDGVVAEDLNSHFNEKINKIYKEIKSKNVNNHNLSNQNGNENKSNLSMHKFSTISE